MKASNLFATILSISMVASSAMYAVIIEREIKQPVDDQATSTMDPIYMPTDQQLSSRIRYDLENNKKISEAGKRINYAVKDARVTLKGAVASSQEKQTIENSVRHVKGIQELDNQIDIIASHSK